MAILFYAWRPGARQKSFAREPDYLLPGDVCQSCGSVTFETIDGLRLPRPLYRLYKELEILRSIRRNNSFDLVRILRPARWNGKFML